MDLAPQRCQIPCFVMSEAGPLRGRLCCFHWALALFESSQPLAVMPPMLTPCRAYDISLMHFRCASLWATTLYTVVSVLPRPPTPTRLAPLPVEFAGCFLSESTVEGFWAHTCDPEHQVITSRHTALSSKGGQHLKDRMKQLHAK